MIFTVTLNPALDYVMGLGALTPGQVHRAQWESLQPGGKGINVSIVLARLGVETTALGFWAGETGDLLRKMLREEGIQTALLPLPSGMTRINVKLFHGEETELNGRGPDIPAGSLETLLDQIGGLDPSDTLVLAGSVPPSLPADVYGRLLARAAQRGVRCVVDTSGRLLRDALPYRPFLIKPNHHELGELTGRRLDPTDREGLLAAARALRDQGARNILISLAGHGSLLCWEDGQVLSQPAARGQVKNSVGAGDSMVAGFLAGLDRGGLAEGLRLGTAAGGATAFSTGLAVREEIRAIYDQLTKG